MHSTVISNLGKNIKEHISCPKLSFIFWINVKRWSKLSCPICKK